ncbi:Snm1p KNAG_0C06170 [Huiozyma naganishii CBS 8797]|uniref:Uncharacterized protein n=1 Tax=Huiozyma naganishii (strain ATCC MYA-139 / BCRC 22969 / CBS 8797 / KCTC 17520 / NBRC 10181 / NCYC 3082 / Yp74L-3) TaxID=1071383 RepID=J7RJM3_HUIN7|nr:hypothetical protein KNAG_0C06170 [Kazachstania naganishii CBS 8797]CCK69713.1 hypothetical protein KNAG_0C06170 [Kazachstania naganishii CBS 8797]
MNREQRERFRDTHLRFQYDLLHYLPRSSSTAPLAGLYLKKFYNATKRYQLQLPAQIVQADAKFCGQCGIVRVAHHNLLVSKQQGSSGQPSNRLLYTCRQCGREASFNLGEDPPLESPKTAESDSTKVSAQAGKVQKSAGSSAKERAKKRKQNSLSNLLSRKNAEQKNRTSGSGSSNILSLEDFMQQ